MLDLRKEFQQFAVNCRNRFFFILQTLS